MSVGLFPCGDSRGINYDDGFGSFITADIGAIGIDFARFGILPVDSVAVGGSFLQVTEFDKKESSKSDGKLSAAEKKKLKKNKQGSRAKVWSILTQEVENVLRDIDEKVETAFGNGNTDEGVELRNAWYALINAKVTLGKDSAIATTETRLRNVNGAWSVTGVSMNFSITKTLNVLTNGSQAPSTGGYFVDLSTGRAGIRALLVHEGRHGTVNNFIDSSGVRLSPSARERDADSFINRIYP